MFLWLRYGKVCVEFNISPTNIIVQVTIILLSTSKTLTGSNQAVNFTAYTEFKEMLQKYQPAYANAPLPSYQTTLIGLVSGAMGPLSNAPIDTIKTRLQKAPAMPGETALGRIKTIAAEMFRFVQLFLLYFIGFAWLQGWVLIFEWAREALC